MILEKTFYKKLINIQMSELKAKFIDFLVIDIYSVLTYELALVFAYYNNFASLYTTAITT